MDFLAQNIFDVSRQIRTVSASYNLHFLQRTVDITAPILVALSMFNRAC
jgi:hypothetical protein